MILFPRHPIQKRLVDSSFKDEHEAAVKAGFKIGLVDIDNGAYVHANIPALYRGWIVTPAEYHDMFVQEPNLIVRPEDYNNSYNFPQWYEQVRPHSPSTPKSVWFPGKASSFLLDGKFAPDPNILWSDNGLGSLGNAPVIIKDWVKSRKHEWLDACFIPDINDTENLYRVATNFLNGQGDSLVGGLVFREFAQLEPLGAEHPKSHIPLFNEHRFFVFRGQIFYGAPYWDAGFYGNVEWPKKSIIVNLVRHIKSEFFAIDVAQEADGSWTVIEVNDGGTAGIPEGGDALSFYLELRELF